MNALFKVSILAFIFLLYYTQQAISQDIINTKKQELIKCKIVEVTPDVVKYKLYNNLDGPLFILPKTDIQTIRLESGDEIIVNETFKNIKANAALMYAKSKCLKTEIFSPIAGNITVGYEQLLKPGVSFEDILSGNYTQTIFTRNNARGAVNKFGVKFMYGQDNKPESSETYKALRGQYLKPEFLLAAGSLRDNVTSGVTGSTVTSSVVIRYYTGGLGLNYGRQFIIGKSFSLNYHCGFGYCYTNWEKPANLKNSTYQYSKNYSPPFAVVPLDPLGNDDYGMYFNVGLTMGFVFD